MSHIGIVYQDIHRLPPVALFQAVDPKRNLQKRKILHTGLF